MKITNIRVRAKNDAGKMKAVASVTFDDEFVVHDIKLIEGNNRFFLAMPSRRFPDGTYSDIAHPITNELRDTLEREIISAYEAEL